MTTLTISTAHQPESDLNKYMRVDCDNVNWNDDKLPQVEPSLTLVVPRIPNKNDGRLEYEVQAAPLIVSAWPF